MITEKLLVGEAVSQMTVLDFARAETKLEQSHAKVIPLFVSAVKQTSYLGKNSNHTETLLNLLTCAIAKGKSGQVIDQYKQSILQSAPDHAFTTEWKQKEVAFERAAAKFVE